MSRTRFWRIASVGIALLLATSPGAATTWTVEADGTGDAPTIQAAVDVATSGDTILLGTGTFSGPGNVGVLIVGKTLNIQSVAGSGSTEIDAAGTDRAFLLIGDGSAFAGITFRNGNAASAGGALQAVDSVPTFADCRFEDNVALGSMTTGGGAVSITDAPSRVSFDDCVFRRNSLVSTDGGGGAISAVRSELRVSNCQFEDNVTPTTNLSSGGAIAGWNCGEVELSGCQFRTNVTHAAALALLASPQPVTITDCEFTGNVGGGLAAQIGPLSLVGCSFVGNQAWAGGGATISGPGSVQDCLFRDNVATSEGGGLFTSVDLLEVIGCTFLDNTANSGGGAASVETQTTFEYCTFHGNVALGAGGHLTVRRSAFVNVTHSILSEATGTAVHCVTGGTVNFFCSDLFGNSLGDWVDCAAGQGGIYSNFSADPQYCDAPAGNLTLRSTSPCAPPGVTGCGLVGAHPVACGPVSTTSLSWGNVKALYRIR